MKNLEACLCIESYTQGELLGSPKKMMVLSIFIQKMTNDFSLS